MATLDHPIPLSDIEDVLEWVDTFKLSRPTKKLHRDFSDAVLLAEMLAVHYPKLVEMHNYPPRNSTALKMNNWMTLNRKVLRKLRLTLCNNTMEMLANCKAGVIERVLISVRDKIRHDEEMNKMTKDNETNMSSGGSYYEACGAEDNVLVVPVKTRVNGVLEVIQQKAVNYESYMGLKQELKDATEANEMLKQKVEHLDSMIKLKDERIEELQKQLERKASRRKEVESFSGLFESSVSPNTIAYDGADLQSITKPFTIKSAEQPLEEFPEIIPEDFPTKSLANAIDTPKISVHKICSQPKLSVTKIEVKPKSSIPRMETAKQSSLTKLDKYFLPKTISEPKVESLTKLELNPQLESRKSHEKEIFKKHIEVINAASMGKTAPPSTEVSKKQIDVIKAASIKSNASTETTAPSAEVLMTELNKVKSDVFQELEDDQLTTPVLKKSDPNIKKSEQFNLESDETMFDSEIDDYKDSEPEVSNQTITISDSIKKELRNITDSQSLEMTYLN